LAAARIRRNECDAAPVRGACCWRLGFFLLRPSETEEEAGFIGTCAQLQPYVAGLRGLVVDDPNGAQCK
jgi:hypothetical protein